jgi:glycosyltransferase involved in cell wall biosynthesis
MNKKLSIIMPVHNEEATISKIIDLVFENLSKIDFELIIVDDASTDKSLKKIKLALQEYDNFDKKIKLLSLKKNKGKGFAIRKGIELSSGSIIVIQDADLEYHPKDILIMLKEFKDENCKVVYGSRFLNKKYKLFGRQKVILPSHLIGNKLLSFLTNCLYGSRITDMETCYKMFRKEVLKGIRLEHNGFSFEPEITSKILKKGYLIKEVPISHKARTYSKGKKITKLDGLKAFVTLLKYRFLK